jgi:hypothetical protein
LPAAAVGADFDAEGFALAAGVVAGDGVDSGAVVLVVGLGLAAF